MFVLFVRFEREHSEHLFGMFGMFGLPSAPGRGLWENDRVCRTPPLAPGMEPN